MKDFKKILSVFALTTFVIIALGFVATSAKAQVCDGESGAAYGLCTAYCESMDCDGDPEASLKACDRVADNYTKITGDELPCSNSCGMFEFFCEGSCRTISLNCIGCCDDGKCETRTSPCDLTLP